VVLELSGLSKRYGQVVALDGCTFTARPGRITGFLGPNGAGKTTAMRAVFGLVQADSGTIRWQGRMVGPAQRQRFGYMPEERGVYPKMRLRDQLVYFGCLSGMAAGDAAAAADTWLPRLGLADRARGRVEELSHGNQQRVQLMMALLHDPELLVLDEPFSGLDPLAVDAMMTLLREQASTGAAVLFSSHQLALVEDLCDDVVIVDHGRVVLAGAVAELRDAAAWRTVDITVTGDSGWIDRLGDTRIEAKGDGRVRLLIPRDRDPDTVLAAAAAAGKVTRLSYGPPTLADLFREAVRR
jgi:ABC-2 type transport system ATP-binding protein